MTAGVLVGCMVGCYWFLYRTHYSAGSRYCIFIHYPLCMHNPIPTEETTVIFCLQVSAALIDASVQGMIQEANMLAGTPNRMLFTLPLQVHAATTVQASSGK